VHAHIYTPPLPTSGASGVPAGLLAQLSPVPRQVGTLAKLPWAVYLGREEARTAGETLEEVEGLLRRRFPGPPIEGWVTVAALAVAAADDLWREPAQGVARQVRRDTVLAWAECADACHLVAARRLDEAQTQLALALARATRLPGGSDPDAPCVRRERDAMLRWCEAAERALSMLRMLVEASGSVRPVGGPDRVRPELRVHQDQ
jgi:hypothetical protein